MRQDDVSMTSKFSTTVSAILMACALLITALVVRREFFPPTPPEAGAEPVEIDDWQTLADGGRRVGDPEAPVEIVEFVDFQCSFCAQAAHRLDALLERFPERLAVIYRHFPIDRIHPYATGAAIAAECAADQGRFKAYHDVLLASQASIGTEEWSWFAERAAVEDLEAFELCLSEEWPVERVTSDVALAGSIGVRGTPAFVFDGKLYSGVSGVSALAAFLEAENP